MEFEGTLSNLKEHTSVPYAEPNKYFHASPPPPPTDFFKMHFTTTHPHLSLPVGLLLSDFSTEFVYDLSV
jgi:hypothetical protein